MHCNWHDDSVLFDDPHFRFVLFFRLALLLDRDLLAAEQICSYKSSRLKVTANPNFTLRQKSTWSNLD